MRRGRFQPGRIFLLLTVLAAVTLVLERSAFSQVLHENSAQRHAEGPTTAASSPDGRQERSIRQATDSDEKKEKLRKSALAGLLVLSLICVVFLLLIILVALWARRIRMMTRQPLPGQNPDDPLWYLRKGTTRDSSETAEFTDDRRPRDEP